MFTLLLTFFFTMSLVAQITGYVDSVEIHRTDTIYFDFGSDELTEQSAAAVASLAADRPGELELYLEGHTDAVGSDALNDALAERRSQNTLAAALAAGWPADAVEIRHFGEKRPIIKTTDREWRNRRVLLRSGLPKRYARFRGRITDEAGNPLAGGVIAHGRYLQDTARSNDEGEYTLFLPLDEAIRLDVYARNHFFSSHTLTLEAASATDTALVTRLETAAVGSKISVPDLYFVGNRRDLLKESLPVLPRLLQFMRTSPEIRIELAGHVNSPGDKQGPGSWQFRLAEGRAKLVHDYLLHFGIPASRISCRGYSNFEMIYPKARGENEMRANRRVEIRVLSSGVID
ncbi:OmpA family protein [Neolewinella agarilytica]|nr:OmpA family protein [Neolewinella agarilytica]